MIKSLVKLSFIQAEVLGFVHSFFHLHFHISLRYKYGWVNARFRRHNPTHEKTGVFLIFGLITGFCGSAFLSVVGDSVSDMFPDSNVAR